MAGNLGNSLFIPCCVLAAMIAFTSCTITTLQGEFGAAAIKQDDSLHHNSLLRDFTVIEYGTELLDEEVPSEVIDEEEEETVEEEQATEGKEESEEMEEEEEATQEREEQEANKENEGNEEEEVVSTTSTPATGLVTLEPPCQGVLCGAGHLMCDDQECWCEVDGVFIIGTRRALATSNPLNCELIYKTKQCLIEQERLGFVRCDESGEYVAEQCHPAGHCFCVTKYGQEIPGTRSSSSPVSCAYLTELESSLEGNRFCEPARQRQLEVVGRTKQQQLGYIAHCNEQGGYVPEQCDGEDCWCVDEWGSTIPDTEHTRYGKPSSSLLCEPRLGNIACVGGLRWKEGQNTCESTCEEPAPLCEGQVARCTCPLSLPIRHGDNCISLQDCTVQEAGCPVKNMVRVECGCQITCSRRTCSGCSDECVCPTDAPYLHNGRCVTEEECPDATLHECTGGMEYSECSDPCPGSCAEPFSDCLTEECVPGCQCPYSRPIFEMGQCISGSDCATDNLTPCQLSRNEILFNSTDSSSLPTRCDSMGNYLPLQCNWNECWCVTRNGRRVATVPYSLEDSVCDSVERRVERECDETHCWCLDTRGEEVPGTRRLLLADITCEESPTDKQVQVQTLCQRQAATQCSWVDPLLSILSPETSCLTPSCTEEGYYRPTQCNDTRCWCVGGEGRLVEGSFRDSTAGLECDGKLPTTRCEGRRDNGGLLECDELGVPYPRVCSEGVCWCVSRYGEEIPNTRSANMTTCASRIDTCAKERGEEVTWIWGLPLLGPQYPRCDQRGGFVELQRYQGEYFCVDTETGERKDTCLHETPSPDPVVYSSYFDEYINLAPEQPATSSSSSCVAKQRAVTLTTRDIVIKLPLCSSSGDYFPRQCSPESLSDCWCVYPGTGEEIPYTRGPFHTLPCSGVGLGQALYNAISVPGCVVDGVYRHLQLPHPRENFTCHNDQYSAVQCLAEDLCFCVTTDSGMPLSTRYMSRVDVMCGEVRETECLRALHEACSLNTTHLQQNCPLAPQCGVQGEYLAMQCRAGTCFCIDTNTGREIPYSHGREGSFSCSREGRMREDTRTPCQRQEDRGCDREFHWSKDGPGCVVLECGEDGSFKLEQCNDGECWCGDPTTGRVISHVDMSVAKNFTCLEDGSVVYENLTLCQLEELVLCEKVYYVELGLHLRAPSCPLPHCNTDGSYYTRRCKGTHCTCVDRDSGESVPGTEHIAGVHLCDEGGNLMRDTRSKCEKERSLQCEPQILENISYLPPDCTAALCTDTGLYNPLQCEGDRCYCVDVETGKEHPNTSTSPGTHDCDYRGVLIPLLLGNNGRCSQQEELSCDDEGEWFERLQCNTHYCYCVYLDTGGVVTGTEQVVGEPQCPALIDTRKNCEKKRDEECKKTFLGGQLIEVECHVTCDEEGWFMTESCQHKRCRCVDKYTGKQMGAEFEMETHYCNSESEPVYITICNRQSKLNCTSEGFFESTQCSTAGHCYCVYSDTGDKVYKSDNPQRTCPSVLDTRGPCQKEYEACGGECSHLVCDYQGFYEQLQCLSGDVCFCVERETGLITSDFLTVQSDVICSQGGELEMIEHVSCEDQTMLTCDKSSYVSKQCDRTCYCVYTDTGLEIPGTRGEAATCTNLLDRRSHCQRRRDNRNCSDVTCTLKCKANGDYGQHDCEDEFSDDYCTNDGYYQPHQCTGDVCYCVDIYTGHALLETISQGLDFYCSVDGRRIHRTVCQNQTVYQCDSEGYFVPRQRMRNDTVHCLFIDSGEFNYRDPYCSGVFDLRTECLQLRDTRCPYTLTQEQGSLIFYEEDPTCQAVQCDLTTGMYLAKQCFEEGCYCVNTITGLLGDRPNSELVEFNCTAEGALIVLTKCRKQGILTCTGEGEFAALQFLDSVHFCVFSDTGEVMEGTRSTNGGIECTPRNDTRSHCQLQYDRICPSEINEMGIFARPKDCSAMECDLETGLYLTKQCQEEGGKNKEKKKKCFCVDPVTGERTSSSSAPAETFICSEEGEFTLLTECQQSDMECDSNGDYRPLQCIADGMCYCVYPDTGELLYNTGLLDSAVVCPGAVCSSAVCPGYPDNRTICQKNLDKRCPVQLEQGPPTRRPDCDVIPCTEHGFFVSLHCFSPETCYCVDTDTGQLFEDTLGPNDTFTCSDIGEKIILTKCRRQGSLQCSEDGEFAATQCTDEGQCFCVFVDTGFRRKHVQGSDCENVTDNRTECERRAGDGCTGNESDSDCFVPTCDEEGLYTRVQCQGSGCRCVDPITSKPTDDTEFRAGSHWCDEEGLPRQITICKSQNTLLCDSDGNFETVQCNAEFCFCVYFDTGDVREDTESIFYPECVPARENRTTCQIEAYNACPKSILAGTNIIAVAEGCKAPECRSNGEFYPFYCESEEACYCRDTAQGTVHWGRGGRNNTFYCTRDFSPVFYTKCQQRQVDICGVLFDFDKNAWMISETCLEYECLPDSGLYPSKSCLGDGLCWCLHSETGEMLPGALGARCALQCYSNDTFDVVSCADETSLCEQQDVYECDYTGGFYPHQLHDSNIPVCVYMDTGLYIPFSEHHHKSCPRVEDNRGNCMVDWSESCQKTYDAELQQYIYPADCFRPKCSSDERYLARQCEGDVCWCVDQDTGSRLPGTTGISYQVKCHETPSSQRCTDQYQLRCDGDHYTPLQCFDRFCACFYIDTGKMIWNTMNLSGDVECPRLFDTRNNCQTKREETCLMYYWDITGDFRTLPGCTFDKVCDKDGRFRKIECFEQTCACIDPENGDLLSETSGPRGTFTCNERGEKIPIILRDKTKCEMEGIEQCTPEGWYPTPDCSHGVCYCVYADSGYPIYGTEVPGAFPPCDEKFDDRSVCQKYNEEVCAHEYNEGRIIIPSSCPDVLVCAGDGNFAPNQCREDNFCFCVNVKTGSIIADSFAPRGKYNCDEEGNIELLPTAPPTVCQSQDDLACDPDGNFYSRQCTNPICYCVYADSGRVVAGTYSTVLEVSNMQCQFKLDDRTECQIQRDEACTPTFNYNTYGFDEPEECYPTRCRSDGSYRPMQCLSRYQCTCVAPHTGALVPGSEAPIGELVCGTEQCVGESCSCVYERGRPSNKIPNSTPPCFYKLTPMTCQEKRKSLHRMGSRYLAECEEDDPERYVLKQCFMDKECWCVDPYNGTLVSGSLGPPQSVTCTYDPPCVRQQKKEIAAAESVEGFYPVSMYNIVQCEPADGSYYPKQCDVTTRECWCVDEAGVEIKGTRDLPWITDVRCVRIRPPNPSQRKPKVTAVCPSNLPNVFCPRNDCRRASCPASPTAKCVQYKCRTCAPVFYDPETFYPVSCLINKLSCYYGGQHYRHGEEFEMGCNLVCYCYKGGLRCRARCLLRNKPACEDPVIIQDPLDSCCKVYACRDKSFMNSSIELYDDLQSRRRLRKRLVTQIIGVEENWGG